ncbi:MAG: hypothetical protein WKF82_12320 [Nocardioidaceae bacterium]
MSTAAWSAKARALRPTTAISRPRLTIVPVVVSRAPRVPFVLLVVVILAGGLIGLLLVNISLQRGAYAATDLRQRVSALDVRQQALEIQVGRRQDPQRVTREALQLGMVQNDSPAFLSLQRGKLIGKAIPAVAGETVYIGNAAGAGAGASSSAKAEVHVAGTYNSLATAVTTVDGPQQLRTSKSASTDRGPRHG